MTPQFYTVTVPATACVNIASTGRNISIKDATGPFYVQWPGGARVPAKRGNHLNNPDGFTNLTLFNDEADDVLIAFYVSEEPVNDTRDSESSPASSKISVNGTATEVSGNIVLNNTEGLALPGVDSVGRRRKHIIITNLSDTLSLTLRKKSTSTSNAATIRPLQQFVLETDADLYITNISGSDTLTCQVLETFYTEASDLTA